VMMEPWSGAILGATVTLGIFVLVNVFHAGRMAARVDALESWRADVKREFDELNAGIRRVEALLRGEGVR